MAQFRFYQMKTMMQLLAWNDYLKTGIDIVDQQHRGLVNLTNDTAEKLTSGNGLSIDEMRTLLGFLTDYAATHFSTEEALMALSGIDEKHVNHHRQSHISFLQQVNAMITELGSEGGLTGHQLMDFLGNWLIYHMLGEDQNMSQLLRGESKTIAAGKPGATARGEPPAPAQEAANRSLAKLYAFMANRNEQLQVTEQAHRNRSNQMLELVAEQTAELAASEERFRALFHHGVLPTLLIRLEANLTPGRIVDANPAAAELLGYSQPELLGLSPLDFVAPEELARFPLIISELLVTGKFDCEMSFIAKSGLRLTTRMNMTQFVMHGQPVAMAIIQEITAERAAELAQAEVQQQAKHLARIRSGFLATGRPSGDQPRPEASDAADATAAAGSDGFLAEHPLFKHLAKKDLALLVAASRLRRLQKAQLLFEKDDPARGLYIVVSGHVMLAISTPQGGRKVLDIFGRQQSIGEAEVAMNSRYPYFAEAVDDAEVIEVELGAVQALLDKDRNFARDLMQRMGSRQLALVHDVESYTLRSGAERVIGYLLQHAHTHAEGRLEVELPATKQLIASLLHITPETLSRIFRDLSQVGLIQVKARRVHIPDVDRLVAYQASEAEAHG